MPQRDARLVGGVYRVGQVIASSEILTICTAYNRNTSDVVGLSMIEIPATTPQEQVSTRLNTLATRRQVISPYVLQVFDWGIEGTRAYIATAPPRGITLQHVLDNENIDIQRALTLTQQITRGLQALHQQGIAGLDLRPQLITVDSDGITDRTQIDDIGLRSLLNSIGYKKDQHTGDISTLDSRYAPPEYINGGQVGPWSDVYQVGLLLFTMVTGRLPFVGRNPAETGVMQTSSPLPRMVQFKHDTPSSLQTLVDRMMAKEPAQRFSDASSLLHTLETLASSTHHPSGGRHRTHEPEANRTGLTNAMPPIERDIAQQATQIEKNVLLQYQLDALASNPPTETDTLAYLCYEQAGEETQRFAITRKTVIVGRSDPKRGYTPDIDLSGLDKKMMVSRQHARIRFEESFFYIEDLKSRNKTRLRDLVLAPFQSEILQHGDILYFGNVRVRFVVADTVTSSPL
ncbi:MAG TPA: FHA domain-containing serine/threonine-protein kinase [Ktedonosporobacter sp.]|jgi:serine/threonine protein kinase|nr:FHA domain-containing serine/threonine-protein kinase [Ktedonosporobacter sp.]